MNLGSKVALGVLASVALAGSVLLGACTTPRAPESAASGAPEGDGGDLTCDERARAQSLCQSAMRQRCESQGNDCESTCDVHGNLPGNTGKAPSSRSDMESTQCRANCRQVRDGCTRSVAQRCPGPCT